MTGHKDTSAAGESVTWATGRSSVRTQVVYSAAACLAVAAWAVGTSEQCWHWFLLPVFLCGVLIGTDAIEYLRGRYDVFEPIGIIGLLGFFFFFLAPILHVHWDYWMRYIQPPDDWRPWLGAMAISNMAGIFLYRIGRATWPATGRLTSRTYWRIVPKRFALYLAFFLLASALAQVWIYTRAGGIVEFALDREFGSLEGEGWLVTIAEAFPILALFGFAVVRNQRTSRAASSITLCLAVYFVLAMLFGGLRGSRANTVWGLFWAAAVLHTWVVPISRRAVAAGLLGLAAFMYVYGFYKDSAAAVGELVSRPENRQDLERRTGRSMLTVLLGDFGRSDVQAFLLYRIARPDSDYRLRYGQTYLEDIVSIVPRSLWRSRPPGKVRAGTEALYGDGTWDSQHWRASNQYGLAGDALLNFGPLAMPVPYYGLGIFVSWIRRARRRLRRGDSRTLMLPLAVIVAFWLVVSDTDNVIWVIVKNGLLPFFLLALSSKRYRVRSQRFGTSDDKRFGVRT